MQKVSVIVPVYNVEQYLEECIDSIINQTYKNIEIILVDDGSTDSSSAICDKYQKIDDRIKVIHQKNMGLSGARNSGVRESTSDWITLVDGDDIIHPKMIEILYGSIKNTDAKIAICKYLQSVKITSEFYKEPQIISRSVLIDEKQMIDCFKTDAFWMVTTRLVNKSIYLKYPMKLGKIFEDNEVACKWLYEAKKVIEIDLELYFYRQRENSIMTSSFSLKNLDYFWALESNVEFFKKIKYNEMAKILSTELLESAFHYYNVSLEEKKSEVQKEIKKKIKEILKRYSELIDVNDRVKEKCLKIYHPFLFKLKKHLKG